MITVQKILLEFEPKSENIIPALKKTSAVFGYVGQEDAKMMADYFGVSESKIFETASFYDEIKTEKPARITIQICSSANCMVGGSFSIIKEIEDTWKIKVEEISCLGRCVDGPVMVINGKIFGRVTKSLAHDILKEYL